MAGLQIADIESGSLLAVCRILRAILERAERGHREHINVDMVSGTASLMTFIAAPFVLAGRSLTWDDLLLNGQVACYNLYRRPTAGGWRWETWRREFSKKRFMIGYSVQCLSA